MDVNNTINNTINQLPETPKGIFEDESYVTRNTLSDISYMIRNNKLSRNGDIAIMKTQGTPHFKYHNKSTELGLWLKLLGLLDKTIDILDLYLIDSTKFETYESQKIAELNNTDRQLTQSFSKSITIIRMRQADLKQLKNIEQAPRCLAITKALQKELDTKRSITVIERTTDILVLAETSMVNVNFIRYVLIYASVLIATNKTGNTFELFRALAKNDPVYKTYLRNIMEECNKTDIQYQLRKQITRKTNIRIQELITEGHNTEKEVSQYQIQFYDAIKKLDTIKLQIAECKHNLTNTTALEEKYVEFVNYIQKYPGVEKIEFNESNGSSMLCIITGKTEIKYWDEEAATMLLRSESDSEEIERNLLIRSIFIDKTYALLVSYGYTFNIETYRVAALPQKLTHNYMREIKQPHTMSYNCWGNHAHAIQKYKITEDLIGAITTAQFAQEQLNLFDSVVTNDVLRSLCNSYYENLCLKNNDTGEIITPKTLFERERINENADTINDETD